MAKPMTVHINMMNRKMKAIVPVAILWGLLDFWFTSLDSTLVVWVDKLEEVTERLLSWSTSMLQSISFEGSLTTLVTIAILDTTSNLSKDCLKTLATSYLDWHNFLALPLSMSR